MTGTIPTSSTSQPHVPIRLHMSMSVDGFIVGPDDRPGQELGERGGRLFNWLDDRNGPGINGQVYREVLDTGAVISGRRTFELANRWHGDHHGGVPIHVLTSHDNDGDPLAQGTTFHSDATACADAARSTANGRPVMVHGAGAARALLEADQLDEMELHVVPVLLGSGRRLFESRDRNHVEWELLRCLQGRDATHLRYRILR